MQNIVIIEGMIDFNKKGDIVITCHRYLNNALASEVEALGFEIDEVFITGVRLTGTLNDCIRLNLNLHCASQVLYKIKDFNANHPDDVYKAAMKIDWSTIMEPDSYFSITSNVNHHTVNNSMFTNLKVKDAIVDQMRDKFNQRPDTGAALDGVVIHLYWKDSEAAIYLDTTGNSIGRHGYRKLPGRAPMLEALAAATILTSRWDQKSPFINPMCGSGTLAIEAALIATNRKPGLFRNDYAFMHIKGYDEQVYFDYDDALEDQIVKIPNLTIIASDIRRDAIETAQKNAAAAGVKHLISFETGDFAKTTVPEDESGVVFLNPEYGDRLGEIDELEDTYRRIGDFFKQNCTGYLGYIFTGNMELAKCVGLRAKRKIPFYNSKIECKLFEYEMYRGSKKAKCNLLED